MKNKKEMSIYVISFLIIIVLSIISTLNQSSISKTPFDIENPGSNGTMALTKVLEDRNIYTHKVKDLEELVNIEPKKENATVIFNPRYIPKNKIEKIIRGSKNIIFINTQYLNTSQVQSQNNSSFYPINSDCSIKGINKNTQISQSLYSLNIDQQFLDENNKSNQILSTCFPIQKDNQITHALIEFKNKNNKITYISDGSLFTNKFITKNNNASLGINYLGQYKEIYWYIAENEIYKNPPEKIKEKILTPPGMNNIIMLIIIASILFITYKGKRLGKVVTEKLPVISKFEENTIGKAHLYRKNGDKEYTANILQRYYKENILKLLGLPKKTPKEIFLKTLSETVKIKYEDLEKTFYTQQIETNQELNLLSLSLEKIEKKVKHGKQ